jgi:hypothetical protein
VDSEPDLATRAWDRLVYSKRNWLRLPENTGHLGAVAHFLDGITEREDVLLHGSNSRTIEVFEPRVQTTFHGSAVRAVFATPDALWPLFFAVIDASAVRSLWNACAPPRRPGNRTRYYFSVDATTSDYWTDGAVYVLPKTNFSRSDDPSEWIASVPVRPLAVVPVNPQDFPFRDHVIAHRSGEPEWRKALRLATRSG